MSQFSNKKLKEALKSMREDVKDGKRVRAVMNEMIKGKVIAPASWDKEPVRNEMGQLEFQPDTKFSLMILTNQKGEIFFPVFSDMESQQAWNPDPSIQSLVLNWDQLLSFVNMAKNDVKGIVMNPTTENLPFTADFLLKTQEAAAKPHLQANRLNKGDTVYLRDSDENISDLKLALQTAGMANEDIDAIYLKERVNNPDDKKEKGHWFIIVDTSAKDPEVFARIGRAIAPFNHGREMEFLFSHAKLAQNIMKNNEPVYKKAYN